MAYEQFYPGGWKNRPDLSTAVTAEALDHIEEGIADVEEQLTDYVLQADLFDGGMDY